MRVGRRAPTSGPATEWYQWSRSARPEVRRQHSHVPPSSDTMSQKPRHRYKSGLRNRDGVLGHAGEVSGHGIGTESLCPVIEGFLEARLRVRSSEALHSDRALFPRRRRRNGAKGDPEAQDGQLPLLGTILQWFMRSLAAYSPRDVLDTSGRARSFSGQRSSAGLVGLAYSPCLSPQAPFSSFPGFSAMLPAAGAASPGDSFSPSSLASAAGRSRTILLSEVTSRTRLTGRRRSRLSVRRTRKSASPTSSRSPSLSPSEPSTSAPVARSWASVWGPCPPPALRSVASVSFVSGSRSTMAALPPPSLGVLEARMPRSARS